MTLSEAYKDLVQVVLVVKIGGCRVCILKKEHYSLHSILIGRLGNTSPSLLEPWDFR